MAQQTQEDAAGRSVASDESPKESYERPELNEYGKLKENVRSTSAEPPEGGGTGI